MTLNTPENQITDVLVDWNVGKKESLEKLIPLVEKELRKIAHNHMKRENQNHTLQTTALMNEAFIELNSQHSVKWQNREHFYALSSQIMRRILIKYARDRACQKRGGQNNKVSLDDIEVVTYQKSVDLLALDIALNKLDKIDKIKSSIIELRYFGGLTIGETAKVLGLASITVAVHWRLAKAWLAREMKNN